MFRRAGEQPAGRLIPYDADRRAVEVARRDPREFEPLYRKYVGQVYSFALYELRDHHAAEDVTAQVFLRALRGLPGFRERDVAPASTFRVWLFQIARNVISNERRRVRRHPEAPLDLAAELRAGDDPHERAAEREREARAWDAVRRLPAERRRALILRFVHEMTTAEIASVLGRTEGAVRVLIHRALRSVAADLGRQDAPRTLRGDRR